MGRNLGFFFDQASEEVYSVLRITELYYVIQNLKNSKIDNKNNKMRNIKVKYRTNIIKVQNPLKRVSRGKTFISLHKYSYSITQQRHFIQNACEVTISSPYIA